MEYLVKSHTCPGDTVLDFTMGSGSTGVACVNLDRDFIGIEKSEDYFNVAQQRLCKDNFVSTVEHNEEKSEDDWHRLW